jgi:hypothetical protein
MYENTSKPVTPTSTNSSTNTPKQTAPEIKQETEVKQAETVGSTNGDIQQQ